MDQNIILRRILEILQQKIAMGAGEGGRMRRRITHKRGGYLDDEDDGGVMAGVSAGRRKKRVSKRKGGVSAGGANRWIQHVKAYQKKHGCSYRVAMSKAKASYKK